MIAVVLTYAIINNLICKRESKATDGSLDPNDPNVLFNLKNFHYIISKPPVNIAGLKNGVQHPLFVLLVHTNPYQEEMREKIRQSWSRSDPRALVYFALGAVNTTAKQRSIEAEDKKYNDIIQGNFFDAYSNLTYKHTMVLKWFKNNANGIKYLVKIDDDVFPNIPAICRHIEKLPKDIGKYIAAPIVHPYKTVREGKYEVYRNESVDEWSVTYAFGTHIIYSYDAVVALHDGTRRALFQRMDDILFLGYIRFLLNIELTDIRDLSIHADIERFLSDENYWPPIDWLFTSSMIRENEILKVWNKFKKFELNGAKKTNRERDFA